MRNRVKWNFTIIIWGVVLLLPSISYSQQPCENSQINLINQSSSNVTVLRFFRRKPSLLTGLTQGQVIKPNSSTTATANPLPSSGTGSAQGRILVLSGKSVIRLTYGFKPATDTTNNKTICASRTFVTFISDAQNVQVTPNPTLGNIGNGAISFTFSDIKS